MHVRVATRITDDGGAEFRLMEMPDRPGLKRLTMRHGDELKLFPGPLIEEALGIRKNALHKFIHKRHGLGLNLPNYRGAPAESKAAGHVNYYTEGQFKGAWDYYGFKRKLSERYVPLSRVDNKRFFGVKESRRVHEWLEVFPDAKDQPPEYKSVGAVAKDVLGVRVLRFARLSDPEYFLPKELTEDQERFIRWARKVKWERKRLLLPKAYRDHAFSAEIAEEYDAKVKHVSEYAMSEGRDYGITLDAKGRPHGAGKRKKGESMLLFPPDEAEEVRSHFRKKAAYRKDYISITNYADRMGVAEQQFVRWLRKWWKGRYGEKLEVFGVPVEVYRHSTYVKNTLSEDDFRALREETPRAERMKTWANMLKGQGHPIDARLRYHPEIQKLLDEGWGFADIHRNKRKELRRFGYRMEAIQPVKGSIMGPSYKLVEIGG